MTRRFMYIYMLFMLLSLTACQKIEDDTASYGNDGNSSSSTGSSSSSDEDDGDDDGSDGTSSDDSYTSSSNDDSDGDGSTGDSSQEGTATAALIVNGHVAVWSDAVGNGTRYTFISLAAWQNVASSRHESRGDEALTIAAEYNEGGLTGWRIPTLAEATKMKGIYDSDAPSDGNYALSDTLVALNQRLVAQGGAELYAWTAKDGYPGYRYLCAQGDSTFSLKSGTNRTLAGASSTYGLRLLKDSVVAK